jgi:hypothetical protein
MFGGDPPGKPAPHRDAHELTAVRALMQMITSTFPSLTHTEQQLHARLPRSPGVRADSYMQTQFCFPNSRRSSLSTGLPPCSPPKKRG